MYPPRDQTLRALREVDFDDVKVVILGQDPYHGPGQAHGRAFSVPKRTRPPPSLKNIFKELASDLDCPEPRTGDLEAWAQQGVLLLNTILTVRAGSALSHAGKGWELFTDAVCNALVYRPDPVIFILWGAKARAKVPNASFRIEAPHPSPLSAHRGFFGSKPFSQANDCLTSLEKPTIDWGSVVGGSDDDDILVPREASPPMKMPMRIYMQCPYREKDECRALGGKWDPAMKQWYAIASTDADVPTIRRTFARWLPPPSSINK